ncbi:unnamed protein product, partial [Laminaria digitata]
HRGVSAVVTGAGSSPPPLPTPTGSSDAGGSSVTGSGGGSPYRSGSDCQPIPGVSSRPAGVPFGASALSKNLAQPGRTKPRGLRPRTSFGSNSRGAGIVVGRSGSNSSPSSTPSSSTQQQP